MQVKTFEAADMSTGLKLVRKELGPDALILSTRTIKSGKLGLLGKQILEITAAIDEPLIKNRKSNNGASSSEQYKRKIIHKTKKIDIQVDDNDSEYNTDEQNTRPNGYGYSHIQSVSNRPSQTQLHSLDNNSSANSPDLRNDVLELKEMVRNLTTEVSRIKFNNAEVEEAYESQPSSILQAVRNDLLPAGKIQDPVIERMLAHGINLETSSTIADFVKSNATNEILADPVQTTDLLRTTVSSLIQTKNLDFNDRNTQSRIAFVGPTGVGKTTTLAKIAARYLSNYSKSIALITVDTYRIAAVEQLKVYGSIMHLPVDVVINQEELEQAILKHSDKELILIDTAGRSPKDNFCIDELQSLFSENLGIQKQLVLSATTRETELLHAINQFDVLGVDNIIMTKIDECNNLGVLLNVMIQNHNPVSYVTNGQRVPEDIFEAEQQLLAELIIPNVEGNPNE